MQAKILDGKALAAQLHQAIQAEVSALATPPNLAVVLVGDDAASEVYVGHKQRACQKTGIHSTLYHLPKTTTQLELEELIATLNTDKTVHGILVQLPLPSHLQASALLEKIDPIKDVDGFHPINLGRLAQNNAELKPCTPAGAMRLLAKYSINVRGLNATIVGDSNIVGRPMALELLNQGATVTICHRHTNNLVEHVRNADLLVVAVGKKGVINNEWLKPGVVILDVGIHRDANGKVSGDMDFEGALAKASYITPVPGGVGPMTVAALLQNTLIAYRAQK